MGPMQRAYLNRKLLWDISVKQFKTKYSGTKLGIWWVVVTPLILAATINFVFAKVFKINIPNYTLLVLTGIMPWLYFSNALSESTNSFTTNTSILKQGIFPREFIPISFVLSNFFSFIIGFVFLLPLFVVFKLKIILLLPILFFILFLHLLFVIGVGILFSCVNVFFKDLSQALPVIFMVWFWVTPIFYSIDMVPPVFRWICLINPMSYFVVIYQNILYQAKMPDLFFIIMTLFISLLFFIIGYFVFIKKEKTILKKI